MNKELLLWKCQNECKKLFYERNDVWLKKVQQSGCWSCSNRSACFQRQLNTPDTTLRPGVLGRELTSLTSVSSDVLPSPEQLSSSCSLSSCFKSGASTKGKPRRVEKNSIITQCHAPLIFAYKGKGGMCWFSILSSKLTQPLQQEFCPYREGRTLQREQRSVCMGTLRSFYWFKHRIP